MNSESDNAMPYKTTVAELIDNVYLRSRRNKTHKNTTKQGEPKTERIQLWCFYKRLCQY